MNKPFFALALALCLGTAAPHLASAQTSETLGTIAPKLKRLPEPKAIRLPASARIGLPRRAKTVFAMLAPLRGQSLVLHGWRARGTNGLTLDILAPRAKSKRTTRRKSASVTSYTRLNRIQIGEAKGQEPTRYDIEVAPFGRGAVLLVSPSTSFGDSLYSSDTTLLFTFPDGLSGRSVAEVFEGESGPGGGVSYEGRIGPDGNFVLFKRNYGEGFSSYTPMNWDGAKHVEGESGPSAPDAN